MIDCYPSRTPAIAAPVFIGRADPLLLGDNGYAIFHDLFTDHEVAQALRAAREMFVDTPASTKAIREPESNIVRSVFAVHNHPWFRALCRDERLLSRAREFLGDDVYMHQSRINYKAGRDTSGWSWHSDFETWHVEDGMPRMRAVTAMIALTDNASDGGPLLVIPGSHKRFLCCPGDTPADNYEQHLKDQQVGIPDGASVAAMVGASGGKIDALTCSAGSVVFFDCNLMHGSNLNTSTSWRTNLFCVYNAVSNRVIAPFCGLPPRPEHIATRETFAVL